MEVGIAVLSLYGRCGTLEKAGEEVANQFSNLTERQAAEMNQEATAEAIQSAVDKALETRHWTSDRLQEIRSEKKV